MPAIVRDTDAVKQALAAGHLVVPDERTGYQRSMYADCPQGHAAGVHRVVRLHQPEIAEVTMRCATCGAEFNAPSEAIYLK